MRPLNATPVKPMAVQPINVMMAAGKRVRLDDAKQAIVDQLVLNGQPFTDDLVIAFGDLLFAAGLVESYPEIWSNGDWYAKTTK